MASEIRVFVDSSALIAGTISSRGAAYSILALAESGTLSIVISRQVVLECERALGEKSPPNLPVFRAIIKAINPELQQDPSPEQENAAGALINRQDAVILAAAIAAKPDYVVSLDRKHFLAPGVAEASGLRIGTPGDFLAWLHERTGTA